MEANRKYNLRICDNDNGTQSIVVFRYDEKICTLDLSDIYSQCRPSTLITNIFNNMAESLRVADYCLDNHKYESAESALKDYRANVNNAVMTAQHLIRTITDDNRFNSGSVLDCENTPF